MTSIGFLILTLFEIPAAIIIFVGALNERMRLYPVWHKLGMMLASLGLMAQGIRKTQFLLTGHSPTDADLPLWALKDVGIALVAWFYFYQAVYKK